MSEFVQENYFGRASMISLREDIASPPSLTQMILGDGTPKRIVGPDIGERRADLRCRTDPHHAPAGAISLFRFGRPPPRDRLFRQDEQIRISLLAAATAYVVLVDSPADEDAIDMLDYNVVGPGTKQ